GAAAREEAGALVEGRVDAACVLGGNHILFVSEGVVPPGSLRVLDETPPFDHCNFTVGPAAPEEPVSRFGQLLWEMSYEDPAVRTLFELEGLRAWVPARTIWFAALEGA